MLDLTYEDELAEGGWRRAGFVFRLFTLAGTIEDWQHLLSTLDAVNSEHRPAVVPITEGADHGWLTLALSDTGLELIHLNKGLIIVGDSEALMEVAAGARDLISQGQGGDGLDGYHVHLEAHDWHNVALGRVKGRIAELTLTWLAERRKTSR